MTGERKICESGFTLLEILIAVAIMSSLLVGLYSTFFSVSGSQVRIESELAQTRQLRRFMDVISTELRSSFYKKANEMTLFEGEAAWRSGRERSSLGFTWFGYPRIGPGSSRVVSELISVRYYIKEAAGGGELNNAGVLYKRRWNPYEGEDRGFEAEVMENVERFALTYFDGIQWVGSWDSASVNKLPAAVKIELTLRDGESTQLYSSIVKVIMGSETAPGGSI